MMPAGRRGFLAGLLMGTAGLSLRRGVAAEEPGDAVGVLTAGGSNVVVAKGAEGLVLVNGGGRAGATALLAEIKGRFAGLPIATLFNTDWHLDHIGLNEHVRTAGGRVIAHEHTKQYIGRAGAKASLPTKTFDRSESMTFGASTIEYAPLGQAHTDGDVYVFFREANVLAVGDMLTVGRYPLADVASGGWLGGMLTATKTLLDLANPQTRVVPGTGAVQTRAALDAQHAMLSAVRERFLKMMRQGMSADDMLAGGITKDFDAVWGDPREFIHTAYKGMWLHVRELGGIV